MASELSVRERELTENALRKLGALDMKITELDLIEAIAVLSARVDALENLLGPGGVLAGRVPHREIDDREAAG